MEDELIKVKGFAPAALVVEFNLHDMRMRGNSWSMADQHSSETDAQYHARLSAACEPLKNWSRRKIWEMNARQWSDYYRSNF